MRSARSPPICGTGVFSFDRTPCEWVVRPKGDVDMELKFHYSATRAELMSSEGRWYVTFVMMDSAPILHEFTSRHDVGDPIFDWRLADQTAVIEHFEERLRAAGYHPMRIAEKLPPLTVAAWTLKPPDT